MGPLKIYKDTITNSKHYASRNFHDIIIDQNSSSVTSSDIDFRVSLRQAKLASPVLRSPDGRPELSEIRGRKRCSGADTSCDQERFEQLKVIDLARVEHLFTRQLRFVPQATLKWELNLRS